MKQTASPAVHAARGIARHCLCPPLCVPLARAFGQVIDGITHHFSIRPCLFHIDSTAQSRASCAKWIQGSFRTDEDAAMLQLLSSGDPARPPPGPHANPVCGVYTLDTVRCCSRRVAPAAWSAPLRVRDALAGGAESTVEKALGPKAYASMMKQENRVISDTDKADARYCGGAMTGGTGWMCW